MTPTYPDRGRSPRGEAAADGTERETVSPRPGLFLTRTTEVHMRFVSVAALLVLSTPAWGQCPNGQCPLPARPVAGPQFPALGPTPVGNPPGPGYQWAHRPGVGWGWVHQSVIAREQPRQMPGADQVSEGRFGRGRLFYRVVRDRVEDRLVASGKCDRKRARELVDGLSEGTIDGYADQCKIARGIGDGGLLQWLTDHREQILALIDMLFKLLVLFV